MHVAHVDVAPVGEIGVGEGLEYCLLFHGPHIQRREQRSHGGFGGAACTIITLQCYCRYSRGECSRNRRLQLRSLQTRAARPP